MRADITQCIYTLGPSVYIKIGSSMNLEVASLLAAKLLVDCN